MQRNELADLLKRYLEGKCTGQEKAMIEAWYEEYSTSRETTSLDDDALQEMIWQQIGERTQLTGNAGPARKSRPLFALNRWIPYAAAASVLIIGTISYFFIRTGKELSMEAGTPMQNELATIKNEDSKAKTVRLEDGSVVELKPGSSIQFPKPFDKKIRQVRLKGEAYFDIAHDTEKPFTVLAGGIATRVVGTSFIVKSGQNKTEDVEVSVLSGKVIVEKYEPDAEESLSDNGVVLNPNQKVTYYPDDKHFVTGLVTQPALIKPRQELINTRLFQFEETPLGKVLEKLQYAYGVKFELLNEAISNCPFTADLSDQPLYTKLDIITASLNAHYEIKGTSIVLSGGSCD